MKTIIHLDSLIGNGVGGSGAGAINLIYSFFLNQHIQNFYSYVTINQVNDTMQEFIAKRPGNSLHVNIQLPCPNFNKLTTTGRNEFRLNVIHEAMLRAVSFNKKLGKAVFEVIKD